MKKYYLLITVALATISLNAYAGLPIPGCNDSVASTAPDERYTIHSNGTVTDNWTGLMWKKCLEGMSEDVDGVCATGTPVQLNWQDTLAYPATINSGAGFAGHNDWRLPNIKELLSQVERKCYAPALNRTAFPFDGEAEGAEEIWSSTVFDISDAYVLQAYDGQNILTSVNFFRTILLVRDAQ